MKNVILSCIIALVLVATITIPAMAETSELTASVTVTTFASVTISDNGTAGLSFGNLEPGTVMQAETNNPAVTISAAAENNVDMNITISGLNFSDGGTNNFGIGNAYWNDADDTGTAVAMSITAAAVATLSAGESVNIFHWLSIPVNQAAAAYSSTFTYSGN